MDKSSLVGEGHVAAGQDVGGNSLPEHLDAKGISDDFFGLTLEVRMDESHVVVGADDIAERGQPFFYSLQFHTVGQ